MLAWRTESMILGAAALAMLVAPALAHAESAECGARRAHRPVQDLFASDVVYLQERGETQLEVKPSRLASDEGRTTTLTAVAERGLTDWWQLEVDWDAREWTRSPEGERSSQRGDLVVGSRLGWRCIGGSPYHLSVSADLELPAEADAAGSDTGGHSGRPLRFAPSLILARDVGGTTQIFTGLSMSTPINQRETQPERTYASDTGFFVRLVHGFRVTSELAVERGAERGTEVQWIPGVLWHRRDTLEVGVGLLTAVTRDAPHGVAGHFVFEFGGDH